MKEEADILFRAEQMLASLRGELDEKQQQELELWLELHPDQAELMKQLTDGSELNSELAFFNEADRTDAWQKLQHRIEPSGVERKLRIWPRLAVAAAAIAAITLGVWFYYGSDKPNSDHKARIAVQDDIQPGGNKATITLADGKVIDLSAVKNGVVIKKDGMSYSDGDTLQHGDFAKVQTLTASTPNGGTYNFVLPDGSKVYLNTATTIKFPSDFGRGKREVELLSGEAFFEISKNKQHPFIVRNASQQVEVLGTQFNVNAYSNEPAIATTLVEGSIKITTGAFSKIIKPGEQSINNGKNLEVREVSTEEVIDWTRGDFYLNHIDFKTAMRKIARWYDVEVVYDASVPNEMEAGGWISRDKTLSEVLQAVEAAGQVHFRIEGKKIIISK